MEHRSNPPDRRATEQDSAAAEVAWYAHLGEVFATDPVLCDLRERHADLAPRVDAIKKEFFADRGFSLRPRKTHPPIPSPEEWPESANHGEAWTDKCGRRRQPAAIHQDDDGNITYGLSALLAAIRPTRREQKNRSTVPSRRPRARSSHSASRGHRTVRSSARSGDSGDDDSSEPEPEARLCACGCGRDISHKRAGAQTHGAACRQRLARQKAAADREAAQRLPELPLADLAPESAPTSRLTPSDDLLAAKRCTDESHGSFVVEEPRDGDEFCMKCGHYRGKTGRRRFVDFAEYDRWMRHNEAVAA